MSTPMLKAKVYSIRSNDHTIDFFRYEPIDPWDDFAWFSVDVGTTDMNGQDAFQCLVTTTRARHRAIAGSTDSRCVVVDPFSPQLIVDTLTDRINGIEGIEWCNVVDQLRRFMHWEYEGMAGPERLHFPQGPS